MLQLGTETKKSDNDTKVDVKTKDFIVIHAILICCSNFPERIAIVEWFGHGFKEKKENRVLLSKASMVSSSNGTIAV